MSSLIETVETFYLRTLTEQSYSDKIDGLLNTFPEYGRFRSVLPQKNPKTADDYISMKFCTIGRFPVFGIYHKRDIQLIAICVEGTLFAIDDCDFDPKFVPHLQVENVYLGIQNSPLAVSESVSYTKATMCSAISTLSLGYTQEKKNEWTNAIVLLMGMTTQAVRFNNMKDHVAQGLTKKGDARHIPDLRDLRLQNRWGEISKAVRRQEYPYIFNYCDNKNVFHTDSMLPYCIGYTVALINDIDGSKGEKFSRKNDEWNGQREGSKGKHSKEENKKKTKNRWSPQLMEPHKVTTEECLLRTTLMIRANKSRVSATAAASSLRGTSKIFKVDASGSFLWFKMRHTSSLDPYRTSAEGSRPLFTATAFSMHAERHKLKVDKIQLIEFCGSSKSEFNSVSTSIKDLCGFNQFRISKEKDKQGPRPFVQVGCGTISGAVGATCFYALQVIRTRMQAEGLFVNLLKVVPSARAATKLIAMKTWTKCLLCKK